MKIIIISKKKSYQAFQEGDDVPVGDSVAISHLANASEQDLHAYTETLVIGVGDTKFPQDNYTDTEDILIGVNKLDDDIYADSEDILFGVDKLVEDQSADTESDEVIVTNV